MEKLKQGGSNWVSGEKFWDRKEDLSLFIDKLREGMNVLLVAQRRMGKTSLMREAMNKMSEDYICLFVDLEKCKSPEDAIVELSLAVRPYRSLWVKTTAMFTNTLKNIVDTIDKVDVGELGVQLRVGVFEGDWSMKGDQLFTILAASEKPVILFLDEVPIMLNRILKGGDFKITPERSSLAYDFMSWLRENSLKHQGNPRFVLAGSIGFEPVLHQAGLSATPNNFQPFELKPWDEETAIGCIKALALEYSIDLEEGVAPEMVKLLGCCIPHHVQLFFSHIHDFCRRHHRLKFKLGEVEKIYKDEMLGTRGHAELTHYEERLKLVLGEDLFTLTLDMLTEAAITKELTVEALKAFQKCYSFEEKTVVDAQKEILQVLEHDGYLKQNETGYYFISELLRDWWERRHGSFFTPVLKRGI